MSKSIKELRSKKRLLDAQKLKQSILKKEALPANLFNREGYQIHHLIPSQVVENFIESYDINQEEIAYLKTIFDSAWNGAPLLESGDGVYHLGSHNFYNLVIEAILSSCEYETLDQFIEAAQSLAKWIKNKLSDILPQLRTSGDQINIDQFATDYIIPAIFK